MSRSCSFVLFDCGRCRTSWKRLVLFTVLVISVLSSVERCTAVVAAGVQRIAEEPTDTRVLFGDTAVLRCKVENQNGPVTWTKDGFFLGTERNLPGYPRYSMIGSSANGEYHLELRDVQLNDDDKYQCQMTTTRDQPLRRSAPVRLTVLVPPTPPVLSPSTRPISAREGRNVSLTCKTDGSKPAAFISWALVRHENGSGVVRKLYAPGESVIREREKVFDIRSTLEYAPQRGDDGSYLACFVEHETLTNKSPMVTTVQLRIQYSPKVNVTLNSSEPLLEERRVVLACNVDAYPSDNLAYTWFHNKRRLHEQKGRTLVIASLRVSDHHDSVFECHVDNGVGDPGVGEFALKMKYKPTIESPLQPEQFSNENDTVTLRCEAKGNPPAKIKWYKDSGVKELTHGNNLTLHKLQYSDQGTYTCKAYSDDPAFEPASKQFKVFINGPPRVKIDSKVSGKKGAENFRVSCYVRSPPDSKLDIRWKRGEDSISDDDVHYKKSVESDGAANHRGILTITKLEPSDFGVYNCSAENRWGSSGPNSGTTHLVQNEEFPTYAILGVCGGVLAILALALGLICFNKKYLCRSKSSNSGDDHSDVTVKCEGVFDSAGVPLQFYPDMYNSGGDGQEHFKDYIPVPQEDNPDHDLLPPPYPSYYTTAPVVTSTTFGNGVVVSSNGMNHYGHSSPVNGHLTYMTYLDDSMSPTSANATMVATTSAGYGDHRLLNGYAIRPLSPLSPTTMAKMQQMGGGVPGPAPPSTTAASSYLNHAQYQPSAYHHHGMVPGGGAPSPQTFSRYMTNGSLAPVDLLNGHLAMGTVPNGTCVLPSTTAVHYGLVGMDSTNVYHPLTGYGGEPPYYPSGVHASPLETVHEVPTPDAMDDPQQQQQSQSHHAQHPPPMHSMNDPRSIRASPSSSENIARCASQLSTHV